MIRNASHHRLRCTMLAVLAVLAVTTTACAKDAGQARVEEGPLELGKRIYFSTATGPYYERNVVEIRWVTFVKHGDSIYVNLRASMLSGPKGKWRATVSLLDSKGTRLESAHDVFENSGSIFGAPMETVGDLRFVLETPESPAGKYRLEITSVPEDTPATVKLEQFEVIEPITEPSVQGRLEFDKPIPVSLGVGAGDDPNVVRITSVTFHKRPDGISADLAMTIKSSPKGKWQAVFLLEEPGRVVPWGDVVFENSGVVRGIAAISQGDLCLTLKAPKTKASDFRVVLTPVPESTPVSAR